MTENIIAAVWREIAIHTELTDSLRTISQQLSRVLHFETMTVRWLGPAAEEIQTLACWPPLEDKGGDFRKHPISHHQTISNWLFSQRLLIGHVKRLPADVAELFPGRIDGDILAGGLVFSGKIVGVCICQLSPQAKPTPFETDLFKKVLEPLATAVGNHRQIQELRSLREKVEADNRSLLSRLNRQDISESIIGAETGLKGVCERIELVGGADVPVLLLGETGSGKEVVARTLHARSRRANGPFLRVNCGAIPPELIDSHLFGHERGSFSGADTLRKGWFERADGGTLFLDEIGDLPLPAQVRLLRVLQDGSFERVGGQKGITVDVRIIAATHRDLFAMVADKQFREDLWYRVAVFPIHIPPLRERQEDIPVLATHFAVRAAKRLGALPLNPGPEETTLLMSYSWPGNVRELAAVMERAVILGNGRTLEIGKALGSEVPSREKSDRQPLSSVIRNTDIQPLDKAIMEHIERALELTGGRVEGKHGAARLLGINPHTLRGRMRKLGIDWVSFRQN